MPPTAAILSPLSTVTAVGLASRDVIDDEGVSSLRDKTSDGSGASASSSSPSPKSVDGVARQRVPSGSVEPCLHFERSQEETKAVFSEYREYLEDRTKTHLGYPYNLSFDSTPHTLGPFLKYSINNLGDPFVESNYGVHSRRFEIEVLEFFASIWEIPQDKYWGYTTTCGTEGNLLGVLYGREKLPEGVLYCSRDSHYSVPKSAHLYRIPLQIVETDETGEMDYTDLAVKLAANKGKPAIISMNAGTTVTGAVDRLSSIKTALYENGYSRDNTYIHCDGALAGLLLPFWEDVSAGKPNKVSFAQGIDSISVSGHKMLGCPMPCGVVITRKEHMQRFARDVEYLNSSDTTIMGSRNGQAALYMWHSLQEKRGAVGLREDVKKCHANAVFLYELFIAAGVKAMLNKYSTTVVFEKPASDVVRKWQLACKGEIAHVVVMPSVDRVKLQHFFDDYMASRVQQQQQQEASSAEAKAPNTSESVTADAVSAAV